MRPTRRTLLVTGATGGIGLETARQLSRQGHEVILLGRDPRKLDDTQALLQRATDNDRIGTVRADLRRQEHIQRAASEILDRYDPLHVLVHNAGVYRPERHVTPDGIEETFAVNHLAPFQLTQLLLDRLLDSRPARVVTLASHAHKSAVLDLNDPEMRRRYRGWIQYCNTKVMNVLFTRGLAARHDPQVLSSYALHPGVVRSALFRQHGVLDPLLRIFGISAEKGAETAVWLATSDDVAGQSGGYYARRQPATTTRTARDPATIDQLWRLSLDYLHLPFEETVGGA